MAHQTVIAAHPSHKCKVCGIEFAAKRYQQIYCSAKCRNINENNQTRTARSNCHGVCIVCGISFSRYVSPELFKRGMATMEYCSKKCKGAGMSGARHPLWKGGRRLATDGYVTVFCPQHPAAKAKRGYVYEHRLVMEKIIGRYLTSKESVHHIDENKHNNDPKNLRLYASNSEHQKDAHSQNVIRMRGRTRAIRDRDKGDAALPFEAMELERAAQDASDTASAA